MRPIAAYAPDAMPATKSAIVIGHSHSGGRTYLVGTGHPLSVPCVLGHPVPSERGEAGDAEDRRRDERDARRRDEVPLRERRVRGEAVDLGLVEEQVEDVEPTHDLDVLYHGALVRARGDLAGVPEVPAVDVRV